MCAPDLALYPLFALLRQGIFGQLHAASLQSLTRLVWALLVCQSLHAADLARALPDPRTTRARQAFRRIGRILDRPYMTSQHLTPVLTRATLRLVGDAEIVLILDSTRCLRWEIFTLGVMVWGRVLPIAWSIIPYPWPKKSFTPTTIALINRTLQLWPADRPVHLLADRGFPSLKLFRALDLWGKHLSLGYTIRLRASDYVRLKDDSAVKVAELIAPMAPGTWVCHPASYQRRGKGHLAAFLVVGRGVPIYPRHQQGPADHARRQARAQRRIAHLLSKGQGESPSTDTAWALLSTVSSQSLAVEYYSRRFHTEGTYRDCKSWDLEAVAARATSRNHLDGLVGLAALAYLVQVALGMEAGRASDTQARARQSQWSTTDRLSLFWRGRQVLHDRAFDWRPWLRLWLPQITRRLHSKPTLPIPISERAAIELSREAA
jgi:hypothetical protein